jgi:hypothetical protein
MGLRPSPFYAIQGTYLAEELVCGDQRDPSNPFQRETVLFNLPGSPDYNPSLPWSSLCTKSDQLAGTTKRYVNDIRSVGHSEDHC